MKAPSSGTNHFCWEVLSCFRTMILEKGGKQFLKSKYLHFKKLLMSFKLDALYIHIYQEQDHQTLRRKVSILVHRKLLEMPKYHIYLGW